MSYREKEAWMVYLDEREETPTRHDYYQMQVAQILWYLAVNKWLPLDAFRMRSKKREAPLSIPESAARSKAVWKARVGLTRKK